ncbi:hypothetical protein [Streptomyces sp. NPDC055886]
MAWKNEEEVDVVITRVSRVGSQACDADGITGFIDQVKHPSWWSQDAAPPQVGDRLHAVVLDDTRNPLRLSALHSDIDIARALRERNNLGKTKTRVADPGQGILHACGLQVTDDEIPPAAPSMAKAIQMVAGLEVEPTSSIDAAGQNSLEELDRQWHEKARPALTERGSGEFFIMPPGSGGSTIGWVSVRDIAPPGLPSRIAAATGTPEFVALSADGMHLCAVTEEEYEYWIIVRSLG